MMPSRDVAHSTRTHVGDKLVVFHRRPETETIRQVIVCSDILRLTKIEVGTIATKPSGANRSATRLI